MALATRKPTIIALRARHTAFRVATDILWGKKIKVDPPPAPTPREIPDYRELPIAKPTTRYLRFLLVMLIVLAVIQFTMWIIAN
jgi:hypothetical protein